MVVLMQTLYVLLWENPKRAPLPRFKGSTCRQFLPAQGIHKILSADFSAFAACYLY